MGIALAILAALTALAPLIFFLIKRSLSAATPQERADAAIKAAEARQDAISHTVASGDGAAATIQVDAMLNKIHQGELMSEDNTTAVRRRNQMGGSLLILLSCLCFAGSLQSGCTHLVVVPADRNITFLHAGSAAPTDGFLLPSSRMQEVLKALSDKQLEKDLQAAEAAQP